MSERVETTQTRDGISPGAALDCTLRDGVDALRLTLAPGQRDQLLQFLGLLIKWNGVYNLTSVRDPRDMLIVHLLDSLAINALLDGIRPRTLVDVGSGAGLPAIPLAITRSDLTVHSVDAVAKKIAFQLQAKAALRLSRFHPIHIRIEAFSIDSAPSVIVSRAYTDIPTMLASVEHLADCRTTVIAMKGAEPVAEIAALPPTWIVKEIRKLEVPFLGAQRCAVVLQRAA